jgi:small subunit ribosomal protein S6
MRIYEELFIVRPDATDEEIDPYVEQISSVITGAGGSVDAVEKWGVRRLAYKVQKRQEGYYILMRFTSQPESVREVERRMRVADLVMKFITVRIDENLKRIEKRRKAREKRAARRPAPAVAAPAPPIPAAPGAPSPAMPGAPVEVAPESGEGQ